MKNKKIKGVYNKGFWDFQNLDDLIGIKIFDYDEKYVGYLEPDEDGTDCRQIIYSKGDKTKEFLIIKLKNKKLNVELPKGCTLEMSFNGKIMEF